ncbi:uncharacterized protein N7483_008033 [Penicillium malachiteum]|uniref:uncharacterized protein n=1 Tax=Penicillium malachiteum TaxID=1324776 RepID=UPI00254733C7|nr:uncharacterized protein N7483_008033 [Penicillium malachiteum]KAJ5726676.1 hypothetical protein N7483_008033 [Penicillium malachiteum]
MHFSTPFIIASLTVLVVAAPIADPFEEEGAHSWGPPPIKKYSSSTDTQWHNEKEERGENVFNHYGSYNGEDQISGESSTNPHALWSGSSSEDHSINHHNENEKRGESSSNPYGSYNGEDHMSGEGSAHPSSS